MWGALIMGALSTALSPVRLTVVVLLSSRPRPLAQLFAYWLGALVLGTSSLLVPLLAVHATPAIQPCTQGSACGSDARFLRVGLGLLALLLAVFILVRSSRRRRTRRSSTSRDDPARRQVDDAASNPVSRILNRGNDFGADSVRHKLLERARRAWEGGSLWVAALIGALIGGPSADGVILGLAIITTSGASISDQVFSAIVLVVLMLSVVEVILVAAVVVPARVATMLAGLQRWVRNHRTKVLVTALAVLGVAWVAQGLSAF